MKRKRFSEEQIVIVSKAAEGGMPLEEPCREHGFSRATFYHWRKKYRGLEVNGAKRSKALEDDNACLKRG